MNSQEIRAVRKRLGLTQNQLSNIIGCQREAISRWENGQASPTPRLFLELYKLSRKRCPMKLEKTYSSKEIKFLRTRLGMTQARFSQIIRVHPDTISRWENGKASPKSRRLLHYLKLADRQRTVLPEVFHRELS